MRLNLISSDKLVNPELNRGRILYNATSDNLYMCTGLAYNRFIVNRDTHVGINLNQTEATLHVNHISNTSEDCLILQRHNHEIRFSLSNNGQLTINSEKNINFEKALKTDSGGTGFSSFSDGDLLVGTNNGNGESLKKLSKSGIVGSMLIVGKNGISWDMHVLKNYLYMSDPVYINNESFLVERLYCRNNGDSDFIELNNITVSKNNIHGKSNIGDTNPKANVTNINISLDNGFTVEETFKVNDSITCGGEVRKIISMSPLTISSAFTLLPVWQLFGTASLSATQFRFGSKSFNSTATTAYSTVITRNTTPANFTIEFFFFLNSTGAVLNLLSSTTANSLLIAFARFPMNITVSIGQGASFNIANAVRLSTTALVVNTWYHLAIVRTNTQYRFFINGIEQNSITSALQMQPAAFSTFRLGGNTSAYNGFIDEFRISSVARYTANFTPATSIFSIDENTISLNHFDGANISDGDESTEKIFSVSKNTNVSQNQILYTYCGDNGIVLSPRNKEMDIESMDQITDYNRIRKLPMFFISDANSSLYSVLKTGNYYDIHPNITIISNSTSTAASALNLSTILPVDTKRIRINIQHTHVGTISSGITVGTTSSLYNTYLTMNTAGVQYLTIDIPLINLNLQSFLTVLASTTSFSVVLLGFFC